MAINISPEEFTPEYRNFKRIEELTRRFNEGDLDYLPKKQLEQIAMLAAQYGTDFRPKSKPVRKALFDFVDMAAFGLVPNKWRPESIGEEYFGESGWDRFAGGLGSLAGLGTGIYGCIRGVQALRGGAGGLGEAAKRGYDTARTSLAPYTAKGAEYTSRGVEYAKAKGPALWEMSSEAAKKARSSEIAQRFYKGSESLRRRINPTDWLDDLTL